MRLSVLNKVVIVLLLLATSCKKEEANNTFTVSGTITQSNSGNTIDGVTISFDASKVESGVANTALYNLATASGNSSGVYEFTFERAQYLEFEMTVDKAGYFKYETTFNPNDVMANPTFSHNVSLMPKGYLVTHIEQNGNEGIEYVFRHLSTYRNCPDCCKNEQIELNQSNNFKYTDTCLVQADQYHKYEIKSFRENSHIATTFDSIFLTLGDTTRLSVTL